MTGVFQIRPDEISLRKRRFSSVRTTKQTEDYIPVGSVNAFAENELYDENPNIFAEKLVKPSWGLMNHLFPY